MNDLAILWTATAAARRKAERKIALEAHGSILVSDSDGRPARRGRPTMTQIRKLTPSLAMALILLASGCASDKGAFGDRTAVLIHQRTPKEIVATTIDVFKEKNFELKTSSKLEVVFELKGSNWETVTWGGWDGKGVWQRATVKVIDYGAGDYLLEADVKLIGDKGDEFFEDSRNLPRRARKPYQELLNEVQARLQGPPA